MMRTTTYKLTSRETYVRSRRAFTLLEMMVSVTIIAAIAAVVIPLARDDDYERASAAAAILASDMEMAQMHNISFPSNPVVVRFRNDGSGYWLALSSSTEAPMTRQDTGEPYDVQFGVGRASMTGGVTLSTSNVTDETIGFNMQGGLTDFSATPQITVTSGDVSIVVSIAPTTGSVSQVMVEN